MLTLNEGCLALKAALMVKTQAKLKRATRLGSIWVQYAF